MGNGNLIRTESGNQYLYSQSQRLIIYMPHGGDEDYNHRKYEYLLKHRLFDDTDIKFNTRVEASQLVDSLENMDHLLIEVTDNCNLSCKYCGYGELYGNYDKRHNTPNSFKNVKALIDYMKVFWVKKHTRLFTVTVGFYGGEPLLNFRLIKETVSYLESISTETGLRFRYNMTTNSILLSQCMDFLCEHKFHLLLSLDGNQINDSYRILKNGKASFPTVFKNIKELQQKYPEYFASNVSFNAVLHNRNSTSEIASFINEEFGKKPLISELSTLGIREDKITEFNQMFNSKLSEANTGQEVLSDFDIDPYKHDINSFLSAFLDVNFKSLHEFFLNKQDCTYLPTGTCKPLERKLFLTVNGKILSCERVGQSHVLGVVENGNVDISLEKVATIYSKLYGSVVRLCSQCAHKLNCGQCLFRMPVNDKGEITCKAFISGKLLNKYLEKKINLIEKRPEKYSQVINEMIVIE